MRQGRIEYTLRLAEVVLGTDNPFSFFLLSLPAPRILSRTYSLILDLINTQEELVVLKKGVSAVPTPTQSHPSHFKHPVLGCG